MAREEEIILDFEVDTADSVQSIEALTKASKDLREERKKLNLDSAEGQKRIKEINAALDSNNAKIKENVSALEKQKINIGNYRSALDGVHPALGKVGAGLEQGTQGFKAMTMQALRFIATPIGAILAALVAVFSLLKAALSSNNAVLDKFENITNAVGIVLNVIVARVGKLGEALIALASGNFDDAIKLTGEAFSGLADEIANAVGQGQLYLDLSRDLEDAQRSLRIETARQENEIKRLVVASKNRNLSLDEQEQMLRKALILEQQLVDKRAENAQKDLVITAKQIALDRQLSQTSEETFDEFVKRLVESDRLGDEQVDKIVDKIEALEQARGSSLAFQEKLENNLSAIQEKRAVALEKQNVALEEQAALRRATERSKGNVDTSTEDVLKDAFSTEIQLTEDFNDRISQLNEDAANDAIIQKRKEAEGKMAIEQMMHSAQINAAIKLTDIVGSLFDRQSAEYKAFATAQTLISTYATAQQAYAAAFVPPTVASPALAAINVGLAIATGLANLAAIHGVQFAEGGWTGPGGKWDAVGIVHADEYVTPKRVRHMPEAQPHLMALERMRLRGYADGGLVTNSISGPINQQLEMVNIIKNMPAPVVSVKEITTKTNRVRVKESISKR